MGDRSLPADASTLIYLAKADAFLEAHTCVGKILIAPSVWHEAVIEGERIGAPDVSRIRAAEASGTLRRIELSETQQESADSIGTQYRLGRGESEVLALGVDIGHAIVDEGRASRVARALGITPVSTLFLPLLGRRSGQLSLARAVRLLRALAVVTGASANVVFEIEKRMNEEMR